MRYRGCLVAVAAAGVLALSGCTWGSGPVSFPDPTEQEVEAVVAAQLDAEWEYTGLGDRVPRPEVEVVRAISSDEWAEVTAACMNEAGFAGYEAAGNALSAGEIPVDQLDADAYARYVCHAKYPSADAAQGVYGTAKLDYLYGYFARWLVPCLGFQGYEVDDVPSREEFVDLHGWWNPYNSDVFRDLPAGEATDELQTRCPPVPEGFAD